jgi:hypothetical protein
MLPSTPCKKKYRNYFIKNSFYKIIEQQTELEIMSVMNIENGIRIWRNPVGQLHRTDGPAIEWANGSKEWYVNGKIHRDDGPTRELANGHKEWWANGQLHRTDGPAIEGYDGDKEWYVDGKLHRIDGPAIEESDGSKEWYVDGKLHRTEGPAVETAYGDKLWYLRNKEVSKSEVETQLSRLQLKILMLSRAIDPFCEVNVAKYVW